MRLRIRGFQSHVDTLLDIHGNYVCITGPNNVGKSSVIRALRWVFYDALRGARFIRRGETVAQVDVGIGDATVSRIKGDKRNAYVYNDNTLEAIGNGAPIEVSNLLGIAPIKIDKDLDLEMHVVRQTEHPFLMGLSGAIKSKVLNALTGHHVLDVATRETINTLKGMKQEKDALTRREEWAVEELTRYIDIDKKQGLLDIANEFYEQLVNLSNKVVIGKGLLDSQRTVKNNIAQFDKVPLVDLDLLESQYGQLDKLKRYADTMRKDLDAIKVCRWQIKSLVSMVQLDVEAMDNGLVLIHGLAQKKKDVQSVLDARVKIAQETHRLSTYQGMLDSALEEFRSVVGSDCPTCGQAITEKCLEEIV